MDTKIPYGSEAYRKLNPHIFPNQGTAHEFPGHAVARLPDTERQHVPLQALDKGKKAQRGGKAGMVRIVIRIISFRKREIDGDNLVAGAKPLRDAISKSLGVDDGDKRISWEYDSIITGGATGTQIIISRVHPR